MTEGPWTEKYDSVMLVDGATYDGEIIARFLGQQLMAVEFERPQDDGVMLEIFVPAQQVLLLGRAL